MATKKVAAIINHPGRDGDWRVDIYTVPENMPLELLGHHIRSNMLGPFQLMGFADRITEQAGYVSTEFKPKAVEELG